MADLWAGITAGALAGAAGATAKNALSYLDQAVQGEPATTSPDSSAVGGTASRSIDAAGASAGSTQASALGSLGGLGVGVGVGVVAGLVRGNNVTPPAVPAAVVTGLVAMAAGEGAAVAAGRATPSVSSPAAFIRNLIPHLAYGAVTGWALHRMLDPHTSTVSRLNPFS